MKTQLSKILLPTILLFLLCFGQAFLCEAQQTPLLPVVKSEIRGINVFGKPVDNQTRCVHWHSELDVIAIKFKCCEKYYPCFSCHEEEADHAHQVWPKAEFDAKAILCGVCGTELSIETYMSSGNTCPSCAAAFNPGCSKHYHLYFETVEGQSSVAASKNNPFYSQGKGY